MLQQYHTVSRSITQCPFRSRQARSAEIGSIINYTDNNVNEDGETSTETEHDAGITPAIPDDDDNGGDDICENPQKEVWSNMSLQNTGYRWHTGIYRNRSLMIKRIFWIAFTCNPGGTIETCWHKL